MAAVGDLAGPVIVLALEVLDVVERAQRQERRVEIAVGALDLALGLRTSGLQHHHPDPQRPEERSDLIVQDRHATATLTHDSGIVVADDLLRCTAEALEASQRRREQVADRAPEGEHRSVVTRANASRVAPLPTGIWAPVCHQSSCEISPGR
jgi:hypothetical protein